MEVIWLNPEPHNGFWDHAMLEDLFEGRFGGPDFKNAVEVYVIPARSQVQHVKAINREIAKSDRCLVILTGDEESVFPWEKLEHPRMKLWVMDPHPEKHLGLTGIPNGYAPAIRDFSDSIDDKPLDWFFAGQMGHLKRGQMTIGLEGVKGGEFHPSQGFTQGLTHKEYYQKMSRAKIALCPPGPHMPDTFRLWEALELACVPIVDRLPSDKEYPNGFWYNLFGEEPPFIYTDSWLKIYKQIPIVLSNWKVHSNQCMAWYQEYKRELRRKLEADIYELL